jgi:outer membrane protein
MKHGIVATLLAAIGVAGIASGASAQSLEQALVSAYLTNPQLEAQRAALRATDELVPQALSGWRPTVAAEGAAIYNDTDRANTDDGDQFTTLQSALAVDQEIYSGGETVANTRRAERLVRVERARLMVVEQDVLLQAVTVYTDLLAARAVLDFANQNVERLTRQLQATRDRFEVGEVTRTDVAQADARLSGAISDRIEA